MNALATSFDLDESQSESVVSLLVTSSIELVLDSPKSSAQFVVVHVWLRFAFSPTFSHLVRVDEPKLPRLALPADTVGIRRISEQLQQKLPKLYLPARALSNQSVRGSI